MESFKSKETMITDILQVVKANKLSGNFKGSDGTVFIHLATASQEARKQQHNLFEPQMDLEWDCFCKAS